MAEPTNIALVGIAGYGQSYLKAVFQSPRREELRLVAGIDPRPEASRFFGHFAEHGIPILSSLDELWSSRTIDPPRLVILATPIHLHARQSIDALANGASVLCEKPLAGSVEDALAMREAARTASPRFVAIGYQWSFSEAVQRCKRDILAGVYGRAKRMRVILTMPRPTTYFTRNRWAGRVTLDDGAPVLDSPANNAAAHHLHNMLYLLGDGVDASDQPETVRAELYRVNAIENYDTVTLRCRTRGGVEVLFYSSHATTRWVGPQCEFEFERGTISYGKPDARLRGRTGDGTETDYGNPDRDPYEKLWQCAAATRDPGGPIVCGIDGALAQTRCVVAAQRSMPVQAVPADAVERVTEGVETFVTIRGIAEALEECFARGVLLSETGTCAWATPGADVDASSAPAASGPVRQPKAAVVEGAKS